MDLTIEESSAVDFGTLVELRISAMRESLDAYTDLCRLGGSRNHSDLLDFAGLSSPFQKGCLKDVMADAKTFLKS